MFGPPRLEYVGGVSVKKVLLIGLDGASWELMESWIEQRKLPTISRLLEQGAHGTLLSTIPCRTSPALPTFYTGKNPGALGVFDFSMSDGTLVKSDDIEYKAIWDVLGDLGHKSCIMNLSTIYPPQQLNGVMVSGACPFKDSEYTYPKEIQAQTKGFHVGGNKLRTIWRGLGKGDQSAVEELKALLRRRYSVFKNLALADTYSLSLLWVSQTDIIQHFCWEKPAIILDFFQEVDRILADMLVSFPNHVILIVSDHGFDGFYDKAFHVNTWLMQQGYLKMTGGRLIGWLWSWAYSVISKVMSRKRLLSLWHRFRKRSEKLVETPTTQSRLAHDFYRKLPGVDWRRSVAFLDQDWGIRILHENIAPERYDDIVADIVGKLRTLQDGNGQKVVKGVWHREELYTGKYLKEIPDVVFLSTNGYVPKSAILRKVFPPEPLPKGKQAQHNFARNGILLAFGSGIAKGQPITNAELLDIAPTVLHIIGVDIPTDMDGKVVKDLFAAGTELDRDVHFQDLQLLKKVTASTLLTEEEEEALKGRLRGLGYID